MDNKEHKDLTSELQKLEKTLQQGVKGGEEKVQLLLKSASLHFLLGHTKKCEETLKQVPDGFTFDCQRTSFQNVMFPSFDYREWIVENNLLVCSIQKAQKGSSFAEYDITYCNLVQKIQGLPPRRCHIVQEMTMTYNCGVAMVTGQSVEHDPGSCHKSAAVLISGIYRANVALLPSQQHKGDWMRYRNNELHKVFRPGTLALVIGWVKDILDWFDVNCDDQEKVELSGVLCCLVLSCCILSVMWISEDQVHRARELVRIVDNHLNNTSTRGKALGKAKTDRVPTVLLVQGRGPLYFKVPSASSANQTNTTGNVADIISFLLAFCHHLLGEPDQAMAILSLKSPCQPSTVRYSWLYLQGSLHLVNGDFSASLKCFEDSIQDSSLESHHRAAALNMIGCCCAENNKPHTAILKFKEALECNFRQLGPLYNIAIQYRKLAKFDAETATLKMLVDALQSLSSEELVDDICSLCLCPFHSSGELSVSSPHTSLPGTPPCSGRGTVSVIYTYAKRCMELDRFSEAADGYLDLLTTLLESDTLPWWSSSIPSPSVVYQECVYSLLCAERYEDAMTVCDRALAALLDSRTSQQPGEKLQISGKSIDLEHTKAPRKRLREGVSDEEGEKGKNYGDGSLPQDGVLLMYKADALVQLGRPVKALECLDRCLDLLDGHRLVSMEETPIEDNKEPTQSRKRQRIDSQGDQARHAEVVVSGNDATFQPNEVNKTGVSSKVNRIAQVQAQAWNNKALILLSLGRDPDALQLLHQALRCDPGHTEAVLNHTLLLWKLGKNRDGAHNWLKFRGVDLSSNNRSRNKLSQFLHDMSELTSSETAGKVDTAQLRSLDKLAIKYWCAEN